ncbi:MAG: hypothetical protein JST42_27185 [Bacteroidetes bacterium]|nr:hypothetical protein [Bacteroidota bacterium]
MRKTGVALASFLFSMPLFCRAQTPPIDSGALRSAILTYTRSDAAETMLYNGILYPGYDHQAQGHPFFGSDGFVTGSIHYDGIIYPELPLSYDLQKDVLVIPNKQRNTTIQLLTEKLSGFTIDGHDFVYLLPDSSAVNPPAPGFYEVLYKGTTTALVHHRKLVRAGVHTEDPSTYIQYDDWYLEQNDHYQAIHNNTSLISAFRKNYKPLKEYLKKNRLNFKKAPAAALAGAAEFYSRTTN